MANINKSILSGNLVRDAVFRATPGGAKMIEFSIGNTTGFGNHERKNFFDCVLWGDRAEALVQFMKKGKHVFLVGELRQEQWKNKDGQNRSKVVLKVDEIEFPKGGQQSEPSQERNQQQEPQSQQSYAPSNEEDDEDIMF